MGGPGETSSNNGPARRPAGRRIRGLVFYVAFLVVLGAGLIAILQLGSIWYQQNSPGHQAPAPGRPAVEVATPAPARGFAQNFHHPLAILLLQMIVIIAAARGMGSLFTKIGQPSVIGEVIAGILLGPSLLGWLAPQVKAFIFPPASMDTLRLLSQIGVILFMFIVGIELDAQHMAGRAKAAVLVSHSGIVAPMFLGAALAMLIYPLAASPQVSPTAFGLFMGVAMSITAFPVLARIVEERGLSRSRLGQTAIATAAIGDVTAWCLLVIVVAIARADALSGSLLTIVLTLAFIGFMLFAVRRLLERISGRAGQLASWDKGLMLAVLLFVLISALTTEIMGIHALFGAFLAGVVMPRNAEIRAFVRERLEAATSIVLLPLFFAFTGLRTRVGLLDDWQGWALTAVIIAVAIAGKLGGTALAGRWAGMTWYNALTLGSLMNTRGLVELIVLDIGYDLGILPPRIFAAMVLMAIVTTFMAGPALALLDWMRRRAGDLGIRSLTIPPATQARSERMQTPP